MIIGSGVYQDGRNTGAEGGFATLAAASGEGAFVWVGLKNPSEAELHEAAEAFDIHPLAIEDALATHERPKVDVFGDTLTLVLRSAAYDDDAEIVEMGQITVMSSPGHVLVVRRGNGVPLTDLRARMEADPEWLAQGPGVVLHAVLDTVVEANLAQVGVQQNEDMRKMSAYVAIAAVPTMVAGIYGMNFEYMPELDARYGYFVVMGVVAFICLALFRTFKRSGWL